MLLSQKECQSKHSISIFFLLIVRFKFPSIIFLFLCVVHPLTSNLRPLTICHFQQTVKKFSNLEILSHSIQKKEGGGGNRYGIFFLSCQNLPFLRVFLKSIKNDFLPEKWRISFILFYNRWGNIFGVKSIWKGQGKALLPNSCWVITWLER